MIMMLNEKIQTTLLQSLVSGDDMASAVAAF